MKIAISEVGANDDQGVLGSCCLITGKTRTEEHFKLHMSVQITESRLRNSVFHLLRTLLQMNCWGIKVTKEESLDFKRLGKQ